MNKTDYLFDKLDEWRHLPAYQLERRADIFFAIYLPTILEEKFDEEIEAILPEFPVRIGTIHSKVDSNKSFKIDYLVKIKGKNSVFFIELKTDNSSRREKQDWYLQRAQEVGLVALLKGLEKIYQATNAKKKYRFLLKKLEEMDLLTFKEEKEIQVHAREYSAKILYIQPNNPAKQDNIISFAEIADIVEHENDESGKRFARSLREWATIKAGDR